MKKFQQILSYVLVAVASTMVTLTLVTFLSPTPGIPTGTGKLQQLESLILDRFIGEKDQTKIEDAAADAMIGALGDRWSYYIPAEEFAAYMEQMNNAYVGVGITIQVREDQAGFDIVAVTAGGPAEAAGIQAGDRIIRIGQTSTVNMEIDTARNMVRGKAGTTVDLTVLRDGEEKSFTVQRRTIQTPVATYKLLEGNVGLVTIENFDSRCAQETIAAIEALRQQGATSLIFDVRYNPGGYASELVKVLDYLLPEGELFRTEDYLGRQSVDTSDAKCLKIPMVVLVNADSYSAAEFFAAALREYEWASVVGEATVGKGYFQQTYQLSDGSAVGLSVGKYYTPKGNSLAGVGIQPDHIVPITDEQIAAGIYYGTLDPMEDPQVQKALEILRTK